MRKKVEKKVQETAETKALNAAIDNVYQKYGTNLTAFYQDVRADLVKKQDAPNPRASEK